VGLWLLAFMCAPRRLLSARPMPLRAPRPGRGGRGADGRWVCRVPIAGDPARRQRTPCGGEARHRGAGRDLHHCIGAARYRARAPHDCGRQPAARAAIMVHRRLAVRTAVTAPGPTRSSSTGADPLSPTCRYTRTMEILFPNEPDHQLPLLREPRPRLRQRDARGHLMDASTAAPEWRIVVKARLGRDVRWRAARPPAAPKSTRRRRAWSVDERAVSGRRM